MTHDLLAPSRRRALAAVAALGLAAAAVFAVAAPASADSVPSGSTIDQQSNASGNCGTAVPLAQTFTAGVTGMLTAVALHLYSSGVDPSTVDIETTTAGEPSGTVLTSFSFTAPLDGVRVLPTSVRLTSGTQYAIVVESPGQFDCDFTNAYAGGSVVSFSGGAWDAPGPIDFNFATYMDTSVPTATAGSAYTSEGVTAVIPLSATSTAGAVTAYSLEIAPTHGSVSISGANASYTPAPGYFGSDSFSFTATNGNGISNPAFVSVQVGSPVSSLSVSTVVAGGQLTVTGSGLPPNATEQITLNSTPVLLTTVTTSATGTFSQLVTIPAATAAGSHTITVTGTSGVDPAAAPLTVTAAAVLAATGTDPAWPAALAVALLGLGAVALRVRRDRGGYSEAPRSRQS